MRNLFLATGLLFVVFFADAQIRPGLRFSPNISINRLVEEDISAFDISKSGTGIRFSGGPFVDIHFAEKYALHTGVWFSSRRAGIEQDDGNDGTKKDIYSLEYVQLPIGLKFFTGDFGNAMRLYFLVGGSFDIKVADKLTRGDDIFDGENFGSRFDATVFFGAGLEMDIGTNNILFGGLSYNRGLLNAFRSSNLSDGSLIYKNDFLSIDMGIKF